MGMTINGGSNLSIMSQLQQMQRNLNQLSTAAAVSGSACAE